MKIKYWISTDKLGSRCQGTTEIDDDEWNEMTDEDREEMMRDVAFQHVDWSFEAEE